MAMAGTPTASPNSPHASGLAVAGSSACQSSVASPAAAKLKKGSRFSRSAVTTLARLSS
jgi:hypothetical protein